VFCKFTADEANIAYVGFTRAVRELHLPPDFKGILTLEWQEAIKPYEPVQVPGTSKAAPTPRKRLSLSGPPSSRSSQLMSDTSLPWKAHFEAENAVLSPVFGPVYPPSCNITKTLLGPTSLETGLPRHGSVTAEWPQSLSVK